MKKLFFILFFSGFFLNSGEIEKIAICAEGKTDDSQVSNLAGRASFFQIYDYSGKLIDIMENPFKDAKSGAGVKVLELLEKKNVKLIVSGKIGAGMLDGMKEKGIKGLEFKGTVKEALFKIKEDKK